MWMCKPNRNQEEKNQRSSIRITNLLTFIMVTCWKHGRAKNAINKANDIHTSCDIFLKQTKYTEFKQN